MELVICLHRLWLFTSGGGGVEASLPGLQGSDSVARGGQILPAGHIPQSSLDEAPSISIT